MTHPLITTTISLGSWMDLGQIQGWSRNKEMNPPQAALGRETSGPSFQPELVTRSRLLCLVCYCPLFHKDWYS